MTMTNSACERSVMAQTMKPPVIMFLVGMLSVKGFLRLGLLIIANVMADATADSVPNTPPNPANRYVCCLPCPKSWI